MRTRIFSSFLPSAGTVSKEGAIGLPPLASQTVLLTGAAGGLGVLLARRVLDAGARHVVLWDNDEPALRKLCTALIKQGCRVTLFERHIASAKPRSKHNCKDSNGTRPTHKHVPCVKICGTAGDIEIAPGTVPTTASDCVVITNDNDETNADDDDDVFASPKSADAYYPAVPAAFPEPVVPKNDVFVTAFVVDVADSSALAAAWRALPLATTPAFTTTAAKVDVAAAAASVSVIAAAAALGQDSVALPHVIISNAGRVTTGPAWSKANPALSTPLDATNTQPQMSEWERTLAVNAFAPMKLLSLMYSTYAQDYRQHASHHYLASNTNNTNAITKASVLMNKSPNIELDNANANVASANAVSSTNEQKIWAPWPQFQFIAVSSASASSYAAGLSDYVASKAALTHAMRAHRLDSLKETSSTLSSSKDVNVCGGVSKSKGVLRFLEWVYGATPLACVVPPPRWLQQLAQQQHHQQQ